jgi:hypothetical protein
VIEKPISKKILRKHIKRTNSGRFKIHGTFVIEGDYNWDDEEEKSFTSHLTNNNSAAVSKLIRKQIR